MDTCIMYKYACAYAHKYACMHLCQTRGLGDFQTETDDLKNELDQRGLGSLGMDPFGHGNNPTPFLGDMPSMATIASPCYADFESNLVKETGLCCVW